MLVILYQIIINNSLLNELNCLVNEEVEPYN